jgi:outer membrane receptor for ferric coprogen and ferric-rhodotorulic acid
MLQTPDMSEFDHIEVLRGANALFGADAQPGASINLIRKRPLRETRLTLVSSGGSWNDFRQEIDVTGPLALDGDLRGRLDINYGEHDYFYDYANEHRKSIFGAIDYDLAPGTLLTLGGSYSERGARPEAVGLPRLTNGENPHLPLRAAFVFDWSNFESKTREGYLNLVQEFGANWKLKINATSLDQSIAYRIGTFFRPIDAVTGGISMPPVARYTIGPSEQNQFNLEATLAGTGHWGEHAVETAIGADFLTADSRSLTGQILFGTPLENAHSFDPSLYSNPIEDPLAGRDVGVKIAQTLAGLFASLKVQATERWSVTAGLRVSDEKVADHSHYYFDDFDFPLDFDYEYKHKVTPFFGTVFTLNEHYSLYASYADIFLSNMGLARVNGSMLSPSDGVNMELGIKGSWSDGAINASLAVFKIEETGLASADPDNEPTVPECCYTALGRNTSKGVDLELNGHALPQWVIGAGYTFNESEIAGPDPLTIPAYTQTPRHLFKLWTNYTLPAGWSVGGSLNAQSSTHNDEFGCAVLDTSGFCLSGYERFRTAQRSYLLVNPRVGYQFDEHWQVALNVNNVLDHRYYDTIGSTSGGNWYGEPRNFLLRLDARF